MSLISRVSSPLLCLGLAVAGIGSVVVPAAAAVSDQKPTLAIAPVSGPDGEVADALADGYRNEIAALNRFTLVSREDRLQRDLEHALSKRRTPDFSRFGTGCVVDIVLQDLIVTYEPPKRRRDKGRYKVELPAGIRFVETPTGKTRRTFHFTGDSTADTWQSARNAAVEEVISSMVTATRETFALHASILSRQGPTVQIDLGAGQGARRGDRYTVSRPSDGDVGRIRITRPAETHSEAVIRDGFWRIRPGDRVTEDPHAGPRITLATSLELLPVRGPLSPRTDGSGRFPPLGFGALPGLSLSLPDFISESAGLGFSGGYTFSNGSGLGALVLDGLGLYTWDLIPEVFALEFRAGPAFYLWFQDRRNYVGNGFEVPPVWPTESFSAASIGLTGGLDGVLSLGSTLRLFGGLSYRIATDASSWSIGGNQDGPTFALNDSQRLAYPGISVNGFTARTGLAVSF